MDPSPMHAAMLLLLCGSAAAFIGKDNVHVQNIHLFFSASSFRILF